MKCTKYFEQHRGYLLGENENEMLIDTKCIKECVYFILLSSSNRKYDPFAIV